MRISAFRAARSFRNGASPGSTLRTAADWVVLWLYSMCIVARRGFVCPFPAQYILEPVLWRKELSANVIEAVGLLNERT